jgi:hypothetical protein
VALVVVGCGQKPKSIFESLDDPNVSIQLKSFVAEKEAQADSATNKMRPEFRKFFPAANRGDWPAVNSMHWDLAQRSGQLAGTSNPDFELRGTSWEVAKEIWGTFKAFAEGDEKYSAAYGRAVINSIPIGSIILVVRIMAGFL